MVKCEKRNQLCALLHSGVTETNNNVIFQRQQERTVDVLTIKKPYMLMNADNYDVSIKNKTLKWSLSQAEEENERVCQSEWMNPTKRLSSWSK